MKILEFQKIDSTQKEALKRAKKKEKPWTVIVAKEQTQGMGRKKNFWFSPKGGLYFSVILPKSKIENIQILTFLAGLVVAETIKKSFHVEPFIKLPNDVYLEGKKICGIITENVVKKNEVKCSVMGIGLNTNIEKFPKNLEKSATSLKIKLAKKVNNKKILKEILTRLQKMFNIINQ